MAQVYNNCLESVYFSSNFTHTERIKIYFQFYVCVSFCLSLCVAVRLCRWCGDAGGCVLQAVLCCVVGGCVVLAVAMTGCVSLWLCTCEGEKQLYIHTSF